MTNWLGKFLMPMHIRNLLHFLQFLQRQISFACSLLEIVVLWICLSSYCVFVKVYANTFKTYLDRLSKLNTKLIRILFNKKLKTPVMDFFRLLKSEFLISTPPQLAVRHGGLLQTHYELGQWELSWVKLNSCLNWMKIPTQTQLWIFSELRRSWTKVKILFAQK